ncbi:MAG: DUF3987 domain-containing protein [Bacteroidaceae bacterium]|nr:DUF3987 domain-containing protein [Bacteroidaceae bacterium]
MAIELEGNFFRSKTKCIMSVFLVKTIEGKKMMTPVLTSEEYKSLRNGGMQKQHVFSVRKGNDGLKHNLVQMNYSCLPNEDGTLKGATRMSNTVGMDIDHITPEDMQRVKERILSRKDELGLLMLELSARAAGYHLVFRRKAELSQEENLKWASELLGVEYDKGAKDITRVFFTTTAEPDDLIYLDDELFKVEEQEPKKDPLQEEVSTSGVAPETSLSFKGIPYSTIITEWWNRDGGEPEEGERNVRLHKLAVNLRAICDNKKEVLMRVIPRYGLAEAEFKSIIDSACKETPKGISKVMSEIIKNEELRVKSEEFDGEGTKQMILPKRLRNALPIGLKETLAGIPENMHLPVLSAVMPIAGAYADEIRVVYVDGNTHRLNLMTIVRGEQASNKSVCKNAVDVWRRQFDEEDVIARKREEEWKEQKKARKANEKAPEDPHVIIRVVPITISCSTLLKRMKNACGHTLFSFSEEIDTLRKTNGAGSWSAKYDVYRYGFDNGEWGQDYNSDQAESGVVNVAYNWTILGTNGAVRKCFRGDNIENGLSSRVLVAEMPDGAFAKLTKFRKRTADEEARIQEAVTKLRNANGEVEVPRLQKAIEKWLEEKRVEAAMNIDRVMDTYRRRAAVIGFRCGVIFHLLEETEKESKSCIDFALLMANYCLEGQMKLFGEALKNQYICAQDECQRYSTNHSVFDQLAPTFTRDDLRALKQGTTDSGLRNVIMRWKNDGWIEPIDRQHFRKTSRVPRPIKVFY